jgi:glyoxylase-like metal-dependent hydrolase (beta-lactamase superfamily II)
MGEEGEMHGARRSGVDGGGRGWCPGARAAGAAALLALGVALALGGSVSGLARAAHPAGGTVAAQGPAAQGPAPESLAELVRFAPDVYGFRYANHVALFIVTDEGVILTDPIGQQNPRTPSLIKEAIRTVTDQPVRYVLYSHWGADHAMGGAAFADTARFVGHRNTVPRVAAANDPNSPVPEITFDRHHAIELGGKRVDLYAADLSSQDDYFILHYPAGRVVMTVDFVQPRSLPFRTLPGHPDQVAERLQWIADNLVFDVLVSGHAAPRMTGTRADVLEQRQYYLDLTDAVTAARAAGLADNSPEMVAAVRTALAPRYGDWRRFDEFLALNVEGWLRWQAAGR